MIVCIGSAPEPSMDFRLPRISSRFAAVLAYTRKTLFYPLTNCCLRGLWKAVNNLGVALLSQGKLKEVRSRPFCCMPCLQC